jgi:fumarate hydratase subunit beta
MMNTHRIHTPLTDHSIDVLRSGDAVLISGILYTARDAAHKRMFETLDRAEALPVDLNGQVLFYAGPTPARPGRLIGAIGPTTSGRMDPYAIRLLQTGMKGVIGKGVRSEEVRKAMLYHHAVYFGAIGGTAALLSQTVRSAELIAYEDLGPEGIYRLVVEDFPVIVIYDIYGGNLYEETVAKYRQTG